MKRYITVGLSVLFALGNAQATVVGIDLSGNGSRGPTAGMLPGVVGKASDVTWNRVYNKTLFSNLMDEDGNSTGATFDITGSSPLNFGFTGSGVGFFETYANISGSGTPGPSYTNSFTLGGISASSAADVYLYATWEWIDAGTAFRLSGDGGTTWSEWKLSEGVPSEDDAPFVEGLSYVVFSNVTAYTDGTILGEWATSTEGASLANRGVISAIQINGTFDAPVALAFITNSFNKGTVEANDPYSGTLTDTVNISGTFSNLTEGTWLNIAANGTMSGTPTVSDVGTNTFSVMVFDDQGNSDTATMNIEVTPDIIYSRYIDTYDNDGLATNNGTGGGMLTYIPQATKALYFDDDGNLTGVVTAPNDGAFRGAVYSENQFQLTDGFTLDVVYTVGLIETTIADTATFGLVDEVGNLDGLFIAADRGITGLGMSLTTRAGNTNNQGLIQLDADGIAYTNLSNAQLITTGTDKTFSLTVFADGSFSYSIDGAPATTGTTTLDLTKDYHFAAYTQRNAGFEIQSVSLIATLDVTEIGDITMEQGNGNEALLSWFGENYTHYELQSRKNLTIGGEEAWSTITNVTGTGLDITVADDMDESEEFYRVKLAE